jgi:hypothetical protein
MSIIIVGKHILAFITIQLPYVLASVVDSDLELLGQIGSGSEPILLASDPNFFT